MHNGIALDKAREYYDIMQVMYGHKFISQFNGMTDLNCILNIINGALAMLSDEQFQKGMAQLNAKAGSGVPEYLREETIRQCQHLKI